MKVLFNQLIKVGKNSAAIATAIGIVISSAYAVKAATVSFVLKDSNKAINVWLNSNANYRFDGYQRAFVTNYDVNDREQRFNELPGNRGGNLYQVEGTNLCLNNGYNRNGAPINVWPCDANDPDQNWRKINLAGSIHLQNVATNRCADSPKRNLDPNNLLVWDCIAGNPNQQFDVKVGNNTSNNSTGLFPNPTTQNPLRGFLHPLKGGGTYIRNTSTHIGIQLYADDIIASIGTPVYAMRSGKVIAVRQDVPDRGSFNNNEFEVNYILIEHDTDTKHSSGQPYRSLYLHIQQNSAAVRVGDRVSAGQAIAKVGHNGKSSGPHLHVDVSYPTDSQWYRRQTVPYVWDEPYSYNK